MRHTLLKEHLKVLLKGDARFWDGETGELNETFLKDRVDATDEALVSLLLGDARMREKFFVRAGESFVLKHDELKFFIDENRLDNSYTRYRNRIGLRSGSTLLSERNDTVLDWPFKDCVLEGGMQREDQKRNELFFNEVLAQDEIDRLFEPKALVGWKRFTARGEAPVGDLDRDEDGTIRENMIVKGNNLLALHSLKRQFSGKVKLIYIDPPYNTGNDGFQYNDRFNHSTWLVFMKNRLEVAKELLREDGSIWINIDDNESHYLKVLCDEIFGRENFVANTVWHKKNVVQNDAKYFNLNHDHILVFARNREVWRPNLLERTEEMDARYENPDNDPKGAWTSVALQAKSGSEKNLYEIEFSNGVKWKPVDGTYPRLNKESLILAYKEGRLWFGKSGNNVPRLKKYLNEVKQGLVPNTIFSNEDSGSTQIAKEELKKILGKNIFDTPKPEKLLQRILNIGSFQNDLVLDFFAGSGTTLAVAHKMGRRYIGIEQMDYIETVTVERLKKVIAGESGGISSSVDWRGGGSFVYCELARWNAEAKEKILACERLEDLEALFGDLCDRYFLDFTVCVREFREKILREAEFRSMSLSDQKKTMVEMLDMNQLYVPESESRDSLYGISAEDATATDAFYGR